MTGPSALRVIAAAVVLASCAVGCAPRAAAPVSRALPAAAAGTAARPNIVFFLTDDLSDDLLAYMPHVLDLRRRGVSFSNYTVTDSLCCPSRSSIFTGAFPHDTHIFTNTRPDGGFEAFHRRGEERQTFATALRQVGYRTALMGKYLNGYNPRRLVDGSRHYVPPGWSRWAVAGDGYPEFHYSLEVGRRVVHYGSSSRDYLTDVLSRRAVRFVDAAAGQSAPFLLEVATFAPHAPATPAPQDAHAYPGLTAPRDARFDRLPRNAPPWLARRPPLTAHQQAHIDRAFRRRVRSVLAVDRMVGAVEEALAANGQLSNTVLVFSSDNGYHLGQYRLPPGKLTAFDTDVQVPLIVSGPGIPAGRTLPEPVQNVDLAPSFEALAGAAANPGVDGRSLLPLLHGAAVTGWRTASLIEHHGPDRDPTDPDNEGPRMANPPSYEAMRTADYTYVEYADGSREFYDRTTDPDELDNIIGQLPRQTRADLHRDLRALADCHGAAACWAAGHVSALH